MIWIKLWFFFKCLPFILIGGSILLVFLIVTPMWIHERFKQWRCKHDGRWHETRACEVICEKCGKNLGFIGTWMKAERAKSRRL